MQISVMQSRQQMHLVPGPILQNPAHSSQLSDTSMSPGITAGTPLQVTLCLSPGFTYSQVVIQYYTKAGTPFQLSLWSSPGFTPKQYSIPSQLVVTTWLYTKAVLHSKSACGHHLALHQSSIPFQVSLWLSPGFIHQSSIPFQSVCHCHLALHQSSIPFQSVCHCHLALHQSSTPFQSACYCHLALHQSSTPFQVSLRLSPAWFYTKAVLHSKSACGCHLALH